MIDQGEFRAMLRQLLAKSRANLVNWTQDEPDLCRVDFPSGARIVVMQASPPVEPDYASAHLRIKGETAISIIGNDGDDDYQLVMALYTDALRHMRGWDSVLEKMKEQLASEGPVGEIPF